MVQFGQNAGARVPPSGVRTWGYVKNLKKTTWTPSDKFGKDQCIIGALSLAWNLFMSVLPAEVVEVFQKTIAESGMPEMSAEGQEGSSLIFCQGRYLIIDFSGAGFTISIDGITMTFSRQTCAPAEGYLAQNYTAYVDLIEITYGLNFMIEYCTLTRPISNLSPLGKPSTIFLMAWIQQLQVAILSTILLEW